MLPIRDNLPRRGVPLVTWALIVANAVVFYLELSLGEEALQGAIYDFGVVPVQVLDPDTGVRALEPSAWWPFFTSLFLHGGLMHLFGNMWTLMIFGRGVESRMGAGRFLAFYVFCGIVAGFAHVLTNASSDIPAVGASGAIAGVLGGYFLLFPRARLVAVIPIFIYPLFFEIPAFFYLLWWFAAQVMSGTSALGYEGATGGVAWWAHIGGFVAGALLFPFFLRPRKSSRGWPERRRGLF